MWSVENRLASAERELRVQFTRIAQLQAERTWWEPSGFCRTASTEEIFSNAR
jgi:hypothetical protein